MKLISSPTDFLGMNIYFGSFVREGKNGKPEKLPLPPNFPTADSAWLSITPQTLYWGPRFATEIYNPPAIYITENGAGYDDAPPVNDEVLDLHRREFVRNSLKEVHRAIKDGIPHPGVFPLVLYG